MSPNEQHQGQMTRFIVTYYIPVVNRIISVKGSVKVPSKVFSMKILLIKLLLYRITYTSLNFMLYRWTTLGIFDNDSVA